MLHAAVHLLMVIIMSRMMITVACCGSVMV
jgi:hypothetical protein